MVGDCLLASQTTRKEEKEEGRKAEMSKLPGENC